MTRPALPPRAALAAVLALAPLAACQSDGGSGLRADASATADCLEPTVAQQKAIEQAANPSLTATVGAAAAAGAGQVAGAAVAGPIGAAVGGAIAGVLGQRVVAPKPPKPCPAATPAEQAAAPPPQADAQTITDAAGVAPPASDPAPPPDPDAQPAPAQPAAQPPPSPGR